MDPGKLGFVLASFQRLIKVVIGEPAGLRCLPGLPVIQLSSRLAVRQASLQCLHSHMPCCFAAAEEIEAAGGPRLTSYHYTQCLNSLAGMGYVLQSREVAAALLLICRDLQGVLDGTSDLFLGRQQARSRRRGPECGQIKPLLQALQGCRMRWTASGANSPARQKLRLPRCWLPASLLPRAAAAPAGLLGPRGHVPPPAPCWSDGFEQSTARSAHRGLCPGREQMHTGPPPAAAASAEAGRWVGGATAGPTALRQSPPPTHTHTTTTTPATLCPAPSPWRRRLRPLLECSGPQR